MTTSPQIIATRRSIKARVARSSVAAHWAALTETTRSSILAMKTLDRSRKDRAFFRLFSGTAGATRNRVPQRCGEPKPGTSRADCSRRRVAARLGQWDGTLRLFMSLQESKGTAVVPDNGSRFPGTPHFGEAYCMM